MDFTDILLSWYLKNKRDLPWRNTRNPYKIWLSEVILQQTRVQQGLPYYNSFIKKYSSIKKMALASEDDVLKLWQGLGYYSRGRNLHFTAKQITSLYKGVFPKTFLELKKLKGVGDYTAAAIASFCFNEVQPVVDGNVYRVLARIFGIETPIDTSQGKKEFRELATALISQQHPGEFNQAIMEFGAIQCVPKNPSCETCPFAQYCIARNKKLIAQLPIKSKKIKIKNRYFYYLVIKNNETVYLKKRIEKDIWRNLFDFPLIETKKKITEAKLVQTKEWKSIFNNSKFTISDFSQEVKCVLSHQKIYARFATIETNKKLKASKNWTLTKTKNLKKMAVPVLIAKYIKEMGKN